jgi:hypothetical protein
MSRRERLDFSGAMHYVRLSGRDGSAIFLDSAGSERPTQMDRRSAPNARKFELLLAEACNEYGAVLHAYSVEPNAATLVLQVAGAPLSALMRQLCGQYSRHLHSVLPLSAGGVFRARYDSLIVAPEYLPHAVRRAHRSPVVAGVCRRRVDHPFSSERAYAGESPAVPLTIVDVNTALKQKGYAGRRGYHRFMDQAETPYVRSLFDRGSPRDRRIVGGAVFVQYARQCAAHPSIPPTREQLLAGVATLLNVGPAQILALTRIGVLGRALVASYGLRAGSATLTQMARWFSMAPASLGQAMSRHRHLRPNLFNLVALPGLEGIIGE